MSDDVIKNPWSALRDFTQARIALGRVGSSLPTAPLLAFQLSHAQARDAVHQPLDVAALRTRLAEAGFTQAIDVHSDAPDRAHYLRRPDRGRRLSDASRAVLDDVQKDHDVLFVIADGLSALAVAKQSVPLLQAIRTRLADWNIGPVVIAQQGRVALADEIGQRLHARIVVMLIGERPGLSSPDSLGIYLTWEPAVGRSDAERNCISNVRPEGLNYDAAAYKLHYLLTHARRLKLSGITLKDDSDAFITLDGFPASIE